MRLLRPGAAIAALAAFAFPQSLHAEAQSEPKGNGPWQLTGAIYYDCEISNSKQGGTPFELDVVYLRFAGESGPQINFLDPTKLIFDKTGWAEKGNFFLSRLTVDNRLSLWAGRSGAVKPPKVDAVFLLTPVQGQPAQANIALTRFVEAADGSVVSNDFSGSCRTLSGKDAWTLYQKARQK